MDIAKPIAAELAEVVESTSTDRSGIRLGLSSLWSVTWPVLMLVMITLPGAAIWWWALTGLLSLLR